MALSDQPSDAGSGTAPKVSAAIRWARTADRLESVIEQVIFASRWVLVVFYGGLAAALVIYAVSFMVKFIEAAGHVFTFGENDMILAMLGLIDASLVASLIVMVMLAGYENFVSRIDSATEHLSWLSKLDAGSLKVKVASSIVAISSIHLLAIFLNIDNFTNDQIYWSIVIHMVFLVSALFLAGLDKLTSHHGE